MKQTIKLKPITKKRDDNGKEFTLWYGAMELPNLKLYVDKEHLTATTGRVENSEQVDSVKNGHLKMHFYKIYPESHTGVDYNRTEESGDVILLSDFYSSNYNSDAIYNDLIHYFYDLKINIRRMLQATHGMAMEIDSENGNYRHSVFVSGTATDIYIDNEDTYGGNKWGPLFIYDENLITWLGDHTIMYREEVATAYMALLCLLSTNHAAVIACVPEIIIDGDL